MGALRALRVALELRQVPRLVQCEGVTALIKGLLLGLQGFPRLVQGHFALQELNLPRLLLLLPGGLAGLQPGPACCKSDSLRGGPRGVGVRKRQALELQRPEQLGPHPVDLRPLEDDLPSVVVRAVGGQLAVLPVGVLVLHQALQPDVVTHVQDGLPCGVGGSLGCCHLGLSSLAYQPGIQVPQGHPSCLWRQPDLQNQSLQSCTVPPHGTIILHHQGLLGGHTRRGRHTRSSRRHWRWRAWSHLRRWHRLHGVGPDDVRDGGGLLGSSNRRGRSSLRWSAHGKRIPWGCRLPQVMPLARAPPARPQLHTAEGLLHSMEEVLH
mmetsp:Transcript_90599/g.270327  ORF Transcript_90599/g.270327 Transcript_90599/m.270327 type:complete len:323 (+) Transcript_90599:792-1760(+)